MILNRFTILPCHFQTISLPTNAAHLPVPTSSLQSAVHIALRILVPDPTDPGEVEVPGSLGLAGRGSGTAPPPHPFLLRAPRTAGAREGPHSAPCRRSGTRNGKGSLKAAPPLLPVRGLHAIYCECSTPRYSYVVC